MPLIDLGPAPVEKKHRLIDLGPAPGGMSDGLSLDRKSPEFKGFALSKEGSAMLAAESPEIAAKIAAKEDPSRNDFKELGVSGWNAKERSQLASLFRDADNLRPDGTKKGTGFFGELKLPDGGVASEYSIGVQLESLGGKETDIPTLVPTLTDEEKDLMVNDIIPNKKPVPDAIIQKAVDHANKRVAEGKDVFFQEGETTKEEGGRFRGHGATGSWAPVTFGEKLLSDPVLDLLGILPFSPLKDWRKTGADEAKRKLRTGDYGQRQYAMGGHGFPAFRPARPKQTTEQLEKIVEDQEELEARGETIPAAIGGGIAELPAYMTEMMAGGIGDVKSVAGAAKFAGKMTAMQPARIESALADQIDRGETGGTALLKAWGDVYIENISETAGAGFGKAISKLPFGGKLMEAMRKFAKSKGISDSDFWKQVGTKVGYNGFLGEWGEERIGTWLRGLTGVQDFGAGKDATPDERIAAGFKQDFEARNMLIETGILLAPGAAKYAGKKILGPEPGKGPTADVAQPEPPLIGKQGAEISKGLPVQEEKVDLSKKLTPEGKARLEELKKAKAVPTEKPPEPIAGQEVTAEKPQVETPVEALKPTISAPEVGKEQIVKPDKAVPGAEGAVGKQAWEMTREEWKVWKRARIEQPDSVAYTAKQKQVIAAKIPQHKGIALDTAALEGSPAHRRFSVLEALSEGKAVPREVLEEYKSEPWATEALEKQSKIHAQGIETDPHRIQEIKNSIAEGELILRTGKHGGRKYSVEQLEAVQRSVENAKAKIGQAPAATKGEAVKAAAFRYPDGTIVEGTSHPTIKLQIESAGAKLPKGWEAGFTTTKGRFVTREEAAEIAKKKKKAVDAKDFGPYGIGPEKIEVRKEAPAKPVEKVEKPAKEGEYSVGDTVRISQNPSTAHLTGAAGKSGEIVDIQVVRGKPISWAIDIDGAEFIVDATKDMSKGEQYEEEAITEPKPSIEEQQRQARPTVSLEPTGTLDPTNPEEAGKIIEKHRQYLSEHDERYGLEGIYKGKYTYTGFKIEEVIYSTAQVDQAYRTLQTEIESPQDDVSLFAMPGKEKELGAIAAKMAKQKAVSLKKGRKPSIGKARQLPKAKTKKEDFIKAIRKASTTDESRYAISGVYVEGNELVATDGRRLFVAKGKWGKDGLYKDNKSLSKGVLGKADKEGKFPAWKDIMPDYSKEEAITISFNAFNNDLPTVWRRLHQATSMTSEESQGVLVILNKDGSLGFAVSAPEVGHAEINVRPGGKILGAANPHFLMDALAFHAIRGDSPIEFYFPFPDRPIFTVGPHGDTKTITMPVNAGEPSESLKKEIGIAEEKPEAPAKKTEKSKGLKKKPAAVEAEEPKRIIPKEAYEKAKKRLTDRGTLRTGVDPQGFADLVTVGLYHFENGVRKFAEWSAKMIEEFGEKVKPHLQDVYDQITKAEEPPITPPPIIEETPGEPSAEKGESFMQRVTRRAEEGLRTGKEYGTPKSLVPLEKEVVEKLKKAVELSEKERAKIAKEKKQYQKQRVAQAYKFLETEQKKGEMTSEERLAATVKFFKGPQFSRQRWQPIEISAENRNLMHAYIEDHQGLGLHTKRDTSAALNKLFGGFYLTNHEVAYIAEVFPEIAKVAVKKRPPGSKGFDIFMSIIGIPKTIKAAFDVSLMGRQAYPLLLAHPSLIPQGTWQSLKLFWRVKSAEYARALTAEMRADPVWKRAKDRGVAVIEPHEQSEEFPTKIAGKIPGIARSERSFVGVGNLLRVAAHDLIETVYIEKGKPLSDKDSSAMAQAINDLSGRSDIPKNLKNLSLLGSAVLWSPRLLLARFKAPFRMASGSPAARNLAIKSFTRMAALVTLLCLLAKLGHEEDEDIDGELNPLSTDFGKIRYKNMHIDITGGYGPVIRTVARVTTGMTKGASGEVYEKKRLETLKQWGRSKSSPVVGFARKVITQKDWLGRPAFRPPEGSIGEWMTELGIPDAAQITSKELYDELLPLPMADVADAAYVDGWASGLLAAPLAFGGIGTLTYKPWESAELRIIQNKLATKTYGRKWDDLPPSKQNILKRKPAYIEQQLKSDVEELYQRQEYEIDKVRYKIYRDMPQSVRNNLDSIGVAISAPSRRSGDWTMNDKRYDYYVKKTTGLMKKAFATEFRKPIWKTSPAKQIAFKQKRVKAIMTFSKKIAREEVKRLAERNNL